MQTFQTSKPIALSVEVGRGRIHVIAGERTDAVVVVNPSDRDHPEDVEAAAATRADLAKAALVVKSTRPRGLGAQLVGWRKHGGSVDVTVELPEGSSLRAQLGYGDIRCDGRLDEVNVTTGAGDVRIDQAGTIRVRSGAGQISIQESFGNVETVTAGDTTIGTSGGDVDVRNLNGRTWIGRSDGAVQVKSSNGDVEIVDAGGDVGVKTANGVIRLGQVATGSVSIETGFGNLTIGVKEGTAAWADAATSFGRVNNHLTPSPEPDSLAETVRVCARTKFGDIVIERATVSPRAGGS
jgi:DUF4097 and DUF4098 domain-containing protein YvlB